MRIDAHCDTVYWLNEMPTLRSLAKSHSDFTRVGENLDIAFFAFFVDSQKNWGQEPQLMLALLGKFLADIEANQDIVELLLWKEQLNERPRGARLIMAIEGGEILGQNADLLPLWHRLGLRSLGLTWNYRNQLADGCFGEGGLSRLGQKVVTQCNKLGIIADAAHLSRKGLEDLLNCSSKPVIVSHAACYSLCPHCRNLKDYEIKALAEQGGVLGITFVRDFLKDEGADLNHLVKHIAHGVEIAGIDHIGIGSDFDGADLCRGISGVQDLPLLYKALAGAGFNQEEIDKIKGGNFLRILKENLPQRDK